MRYIMLALLCLIGCETTEVKPEREKTGTIVCEGASPMRFKGFVGTSGPWISFTTEEGMYIRTSFPCAVMWDRE